MCGGWWIPHVGIVARKPDGRMRAGCRLSQRGGGALPGGVQFDPLGTQFQPGDPWGRRGKGSVSILSQSAESSASELDPTGEGVINE